MLFLLLFFVPSVYAVSIASPDLDSEYRIDEGDDFSVDFRLRGDSLAREVEFFIKADKIGIEFNNRDTYKETFNLGVYEIEEIEIFIEGNQPGDYVVEYGFIDRGSEDVMFEQVVSRTFIIEVDGEGSQANETNNDTVDSGDGVDINVPSSSSPSSSSSSSSSAGRSGGGAGYFPVDEEPESTTTKPKSTSSSDRDSDVSFQDISAQGSSLTETTVSGSLPGGFGIGGESMDLNAEKLLILAMSVALLSLTLHGVTIASMRGEE